MRLSELIKYYSRADVSNAMISFAQNREVAIQFNDKFGKRPDILQFPSDIMGVVRKGATSFHGSEEIWRDPLQLSSESTKKNMDELRAGWDLVIDIDCKLFEWSTICAQLLLDALKFHEITCASLKFSGGTGWHIGVPGIALSAESLPFPETPQIIAQYLKEFIRPHLSDRILEYEKDIKKIIEKSNKKKEDIFKDNEFDPFTILGIDTIAIAPRHMIRMPYSFNEKRWRVSLPINVKQISEFKLEWANVENVELKEVFLSKENIREGEATQLLLQALDWWNKQHEQTEGEKTKIEFEFSDKVPVEAFPPCMKLILAGLPDGRKRGLFALINFMKSAKWSWQEIESEIKSVNNRNSPPLKTGYLQAQINWYRRQTSKFPPPNCRQFYQDFGVCKPDHTCDIIKNPISYPWHKLKKQNKE